METLQWILIGISVPIIVAMVVQTRKRAKALTERIEEYLEEEEAAKSGPANPYPDMSTLFGRTPDAKTGTREHPRNGG